MSAGSEELLAKLSIDVQQVVAGVQQINAALATGNKAVETLVRANKKLAVSAELSAQKRFAASVKIQQQKQKESATILASMQREDVAYQKRIAASIKVQKQKQKEASTILASMKQEENALKRLQAQRLAANQQRFIASVNAKKARQSQAMLIRQAMVTDEKASKQIISNAHKQNKAVQSVTLSWGSLARLLAVQLTHQAVSVLVRGIREGVTEAKELSIRISEIQTISQQQQLPFDQWARGLREVSEAFGLDILDTAESAYQAISNQVAKGAETFKFMATSAEFAITTVSSAGDSVNLLTAALNAFKLGTDQTERVAANFFKTIELGRVRSQEMANGFGRIAVPAQQLGVQLEELNAIVSLSTIRGMRYSETTTQIRNLFVKLLKPTKDMKELFKDIGVESGEAAIQTFGLAGFLKILGERTAGSSTEVAKFFPNIRGMNVAMLLAAKGGLAEFNKTVAAGTDALESYREASKIVMENAGRQFEIEISKIKNYFVVDIGVTAVETLVWFNKNLITTTTLVKALTQVIGVGLIAAVVKLGAVVIPLAILNPHIAILLAALTAIAVTVNKINEIDEREAANWKKNWENRRKAAEESINRVARVVEKSLTDQQRSVLTGIAAIQGGWTQLSTSQDSIIKDSIASSSELSKKLAKDIKDNIKAIDKQITETRSKIDSIKDFNKSFAKTIESSIFEEGLNRLLPAEQIKQLSNRVNELKSLAAIAAKSGDVSSAKDLLKEALKLEQRITAIDKAASDKKKKLDKDRNDILVDQAEKLKELELKKRKEIHDRDFKAARKTQEDIRDLREETQKKLKDIDIERAKFQGKEIGNYFDNYITRYTELFKLQKRLSEELATEETKKQVTLIAERKRQFINQKDFEVAYTKFKEFDLDKILKGDDPAKIQEALKSRQESINDLIAAQIKLDKESDNSLLNELKKAEQLKGLARVREIQLKKERDDRVKATEELKSQLEIFRKATVEATELSEKYDKLKESIEKNIDIPLTGDDSIGKKASTLFKQFDAGIITFAQLHKGIVLINQDIATLTARALSFQEEEGLNRLKLAVASAEQILSRLAKPTQGAERLKNILEELKTVNKEIAADSDKDGKKRLTTLETAANAQREFIKQQKIILTLDERRTELLGKQAEFLKQQNIVTKFKSNTVNLPTKAKGGMMKGSDRIPALLSPGEFVVNADSTRKFYSQLVGMNSGAQGFNKGGSTTTVGDISVNMQSSGSESYDAVKLGRALQRQVRRGTLKF